MTVTILLADDHPFVRRGTRGLLETVSGWSVVGEAEDGLQVIELAEKLKPHVLVVDLMMPNLNGLEALKQIHKRLPDIHMIVLSMQSADPYVHEAFQSGATGYVLKDSAPDELVDAILQALNGEKYLSPKLSTSNVLEARYTKGRDPYEALTDRERQVFQMAAEGKSSTEIGRKLNISPRTVEIHRSNLMKKLSLKNQADLIRYAIKQGILPMEDLH